MSLTVIRRANTVRLNEVTHFLAFVKSTENPDPQVPISLETKIMKGLFYVHLYSAYEKSINEIFKVALSEISSINLQTKLLSSSLASIALKNQFQSIAESRDKELKRLQKAQQIFLDFISEESASIDEGIFERTFQNIWFADLAQVLDFLGADKSLLAGDRPLIDEIVSKRNAVAHGRDAASQVGTNTIDELTTKSNRIREILEIVADSLEEYLSAKRYLK